MKRVTSLTLQGMFLVKEAEEYLRGVNEQVADDVEAMCAEVRDA